MSVAGTNANMNSLELNSICHVCRVQVEELSKGNRNY